MISLIIPVYNVRPYLDVCLKSVARQTCADFECILVDDGSTDGSAELCDAWATRDKHIRVIHQPNGGVSAARNRGLDEACGEWVCFVDSDDWIDDSYLEKLSQAHAASEADLVVCGLCREETDGSVVSATPEQSAVWGLTPANTKKFVELNERSLLYGPMVKLYRKAVIDGGHVRFPSGVSYGEDLQFNYQYLNYVRVIATVAESLYHYRIIGQGTLSSKVREDQFQTDYRQWLILKDFYVRHDMWNIVSQRYLYRRLWGGVYDALFLYPRLSNPAKDYFSKILSVPEIRELWAWREVFHCTAWIKWAVLFRTSWAFEWHFKR